MPSRLISFTSTGKQTFTVPDYVDYIKVEVFGAGGGHSGYGDLDKRGLGGHGGYIRKDKYSVNPGETFHPYIGERGDDGKDHDSNDSTLGGNGGSGWYNGGDGGEPDAGGGGGGGGGGGSTTFLDASDNMLLVADAGGGGGSEDKDEVEYGGPGGGGARGGDGGKGEDTFYGEDGAGSGYGGDGGDGGNNGDVDNGDPGGQESNIGSDATDYGGGNSGNGRVSIYYNQSVTDLSLSSSTGGESDFSWSSISDVNTYSIYRSESSGSQTADYTEIDSNVSDTATSYTDTTREDGVQYYYRIQNIDSYDERLSNEVSGISYLPPVSNFDVVDTDQGLEASWTKEDNTTRGSITVERSDDGGSTWSQIATGLSPSTTSYEDTSIDYGVKYTYRALRIVDTTAASAESTEAAFGSRNKSAGGVLNTNNGVIGTLE